MLSEAEIGMADYFDEVEAELREAQRIDPEVILPWSWWKKLGDRHGMTANAVYTRAIKAGLYVHPSKRETPYGANGSRGTESRVASPAPRPPQRSTDPDLSQIVTEPNVPPLPQEAGADSCATEECVRSESGRPPASTVPGNGSHSSSPEHGAESSHAIPAGGLGEALHSFASLLERTAGLEQKVANLTRELQETVAENRRLKRALREMDEMAEKMRQHYRRVLQED